MLWGNEYPSNAPYPKNTYVTQNGWVGITLKDDVNTPLEPVFFGDNRQLVSNENFTTQQSNGTILQTYNLSFNKSGRITLVSKQVPEITANTEYTVVVKNVVTGEAQTISTVTNIANEWETVIQSNTIVNSNTVLELSIISKNNSTTTEVTGGWARIGNGVIPVNNGDWSISNNGRTLRMLKTDLDSVFRGTELLGFVSGTEIKFTDTLNPTQSITYLNTADPIDQGSYVEYQVSIKEPVGNIPVGNSCTMSALVPVPALTSYFVEQDYFLNNPSDFCDVVSSLSIDGVLQPNQTNNAYGLSLEFEGGEVSGDYKITVSPNGGVSSSSQQILSVSFPLMSLDEDYQRNYSSGYKPSLSLPLTDLNKFDIEKCYILSRNQSGGFLGGVFFEIRDNSGINTYFYYSGSVESEDPVNIELTPNLEVPSDKEVNLRLYAACTGGTVYINSVIFILKQK